MTMLPVSQRRFAREPNHAWSIWIWNTARAIVKRSEPPALHLPVVPGEGIWQRGGTHQVDVVVFEGRIPFRADGKLRE